MITPLILLNNNKIQNIIVDKLTEFAEEKTGAKFDIKHVSLKSFNQINIKSVEAKDLNSQIFLSIDNLGARISLRALFKGNIVIDDIIAENLSTSLYTNSDNTLNIQFLIDKLTPKQKVATPNLIFPLITLNNASFIFHDTNTKSTKVKSWQFDPTDIHIDSLYTQIQFSILNQTNLSANINYLRLKEKSGLKLSHISTYAEITDSTFIIPYAIIDLTDTHLVTDSTIIRVSRNKEDKVDWEKTSFRFNINEANINLSELKHFYPELERLNSLATISGKIEGTLDNLKATKLRATYGNTLSISADINAIGLPDIKNTYFKGAINHIRFDKASTQDIIANVTKQPFTLPNELNNLGTCKYSGEISGYISNLVLYGNLNTAIGDIRTDINLRIRDRFNQFLINGRIGSKQLMLGKLLPNSGLGNIAFETNSDISAGTNQPLMANTKINIHNFGFLNYNYKNIRIDGYLDPTLFSGKLHLDDPNCHFDFDGKISNIDNFKHFDFTANLSNINLNQLNLIKTHPDLTISLSTKSNFSGEQWSTMEGYVNIDSLYLTNNTKEFFLNQLALNATNDSISSASIKSDIVNGGISGNYNISSLANHAISIAAKSMPILSNFVKPTDKTNDITCILAIEPLKPLLQTIDIPWFTNEQSSIYAHLNSETSKLDAEIYIPNLSNGKLNIDSIDLKINNQINNAINIVLSATTNLKESHLNTSINVGCNFIV